MAERIIGIDLGTTNSVIAVLQSGEPHIIPTAEGGNLCPSIVGFTPSGERVVGDIARRQLLTHPLRTIASVKRFMGTRKKLTVAERDYTPQEISAMILHKLRVDAETYLGEPIKKAVITVPAYFSDAQRQATKDAGRIAGLDVVRMVNEPTAAALAYGLDRRQVNTVLVWDLGGGTFDVSILTLGDGVFQVCSTNGDTRLGGDDWDACLVNHLMRAFWHKEGIDLRQDRLAIQRLKDAAETAKIRLSTQESVTISLPFLAAKDGQPRHLELDLTRQEFEEMTAELRQRMIEPTAQAFTDAGLKPRDLGAVILVGGSTRMPAVQRMVREILLHEPVVGLNPDEVVALGAAVQAGIISGELENMVLLDVTPLSLGIETANGTFNRIIPRNTTIPTSETKLFTTSRDLQQAVEIHVLQGERDIAAHNKSLGRFSLRGISPAPRGVPRIEVTFDIDANGIVHVSARDLSTNVEQHVVMVAGSGLTEEEIETIVTEAEIFSTLDRQIIETAELRNQSEELLDSLNDSLNKLGDAVPIQELARLDKGMLRMREALDDGQPAELRAALDALHDLALLLLPYGAQIKSSATPDTTPPLNEPYVSERNSQYSGTRGKTANR